MEKKKIVIVSGILLLIAAAASYVLYLNKSQVADKSQITDKPQQETQEQADATQNNPLKYSNEEYGFEFNLPDSWKGYSIVVGKWQGTIAGDKGETVVAEGPQLSIRHPQWTEQKPRQDIPIMIFTISEWSDMQSDKFHIGAAPINPSELGRNNKYVFALPARYNYAFPDGYQEVENILAGNPLHAFNLNN